MAILEQDIQLLASRIMSDAPESGGGMTANVIVDGASNNIFPDISTLDTIYGSTQIRQVFPAVRTNNTDTYYGQRTIISDPPLNPKVSATLFSTGNFNSIRSEAASRIEAYLSQGALLQGLLFNNHIAGQATVMLLQRVGTTPPAIGETIVLRKFEGLVNQFEQYVRVNRVSLLVRTFTDASGDYQRTQVTLEISDTLRDDFDGFPASRNDTDLDYTGRTKVYESIVADAARYYGISPLSAAVTANDFTVKVASIFTQLVPSAQSETPVADARANQQIAAPIPASGEIIFIRTFVFGLGQNLFIGGNVLPGSISIASAALTYSDDGAGRLIVLGAQAGTVDYSNGLCVVTIGAPVSENWTVKYKSATTPTLVTDSQSIIVSIATRALNYVTTLETRPASGSLTVSYLALGRWYTLRDDGSGSLRGSSSSIGAGSINPDTNTVTITLGALPDVGSRVLLNWGSSNPTIPIATTALALGFEASSATPLTPSTVALTWTHSGAKTATDDGNGNLTGDATGTVNYATGKIRFLPTLLPPQGTTFSLASTNRTPVAVNVALFADGGANWTYTLGGPIQTKSFIGKIGALFPGYSNLPLSRTVIDDGAGLLKIVTNAATGTLTTVGTINYATGALSFIKTVAIAGSFVTESTLVREDNGIYRTVSRVTATPNTFVFWNVGTAGVNALECTYTSGSSGAATAAGTFNTLNGFVSLTDGLLLSPSSFRMTLDGDALHSEETSAISARLMSGLVQVGTVGATGIVSITAWATGTPPVAALTSAVQISQRGVLVSGMEFRTALAPLRPGSFSFSFTLVNGSSFVVTADSTGLIDNANAVGRIDWQTGVCEIRIGAKQAVLGASPPANRISIAHLLIPGGEFIDAAFATADSFRYNAVGYTYLPLDASVLGLDPVRLPTDGRVPIFRAGSVVSLHNTKTTAAATVSNAQVVNTARTGLARVRVIGANDVVITTGYTADLAGGTVTFTNVTGYSQPVRVEHRIEQAALLADVQINGDLRFSQAVPRSFDLAGSYVSSALIGGNVYARVSGYFDQETWTNEWSDSVIGANAAASMNLASYPIAVNNVGCIEQRWALVFTGPTSFNIVGEIIGIIGTGTTGTTTAPINPDTLTPYFSINPLAFGSGWSAGNAVRFPTKAAAVPLQVVRTVGQGAALSGQDRFIIGILGDVDA